MAGRFAGHSAFITGASSGIGAAVAKRLALEGAKVSLAARRRDRLEAVRREIEEECGDAIIAVCDVTDRKSIDSAVAKTIKEFKGIDIVLANAGFAVSGSFDRRNTEDFRRQFDTNFFGVVDTIYATFPYLKKSKGRLGIVSSLGGLMGSAGSSVYCSSKFALCGLAESLDPEFVRLGISVTNIIPGFIESEIGQVDSKGVFRPDRTSPVPSWIAASAESAAQEITDALYRRRSEAVITVHAKVLALAGRYLPHLVHLGQRLTAGEVTRIVDTFSSSQRTGRSRNSQPRTRKLAKS